MTPTHADHADRRTRHRHHPGRSAGRGRPPAGRGPRRRVRPARGFRHRRHPEPRAVHRPGPRAEPARRDHHHAQPGRATPGEHGDAGGHRTPGPGAAADRSVAGGVTPTASGRLRTADGAGWSGRGSGRPATGGQPGLAELAALLLGGGAPDTRLLVGGQGEVETGLLYLAAAADPLGRLDLVDGGPVVPMGKNRSGSVLRQAANWRQSPSSHSTVRFHMRATLIPPLIDSDYPLVICFT